MNNINFTPFPVLETERIVLRKPVQSDAEYIFELRSDEEYSRFTGIKRYESIKEAVTYLTKIDGMIGRNESILWSIVIKATGEFIGSICLWNISDNKLQAEIGYDLLPKFRGHGYIQDAAKAVISYAFKELKLDSVVAEEVRIGNIKSIRVLEAGGFKLKGIHESQVEDGTTEKRANYILSRST